MKNTNLPSGFSLVELLVVITIIAILSVATTAGFGRLQQTLTLRQTIGLITDTIKRTELEVTRGDYEKATIYFIPDYLVITENIEDATLDLSFTPTTPTEINIGSAGNLFKKDENNTTLSINAIPATPNYSIGSFSSAPQRIWSYQLESDNGFSDIIRFVHFNIDREEIVQGATELSDAMSLVVGNDSYSLQIEAPYAKRTYFKNSVSVNGFDLTLSTTPAASSDAVQETLILGSTAP